MRAVMNRSIRASVALATLLSVSAASAAQLPVSSRSLAAGTSAVPRCDTAITEPTFTYSGANVTHVTINGLSAACDGQSLTIVLVDSDGSQKATAGPFTVPTGRTTELAGPFDVTPNNLPGSTFSTAHVVVTK